MRFPIALLLLASLSATLSAQSTPPPPEARQFDFWVGEWEVFDPSGKKVGENSIQLAHNRWVLVENWRGASGVTGSSLSLFNNADPKHWTQYWADNSGGELLMKAGLVNGSMLLEEKSTDAQGHAVVNRTTWTPNADGTVQQIWELSRDGGKTWTTLFQNLYTRKK